MAQGPLGNKLVVIGGSAGSLDVILNIFSVIPARTGASYVVVIHRKHDNDSIFAELISGRSSMEVTEVEDKDPIVPNHIYIAPADYHLLIEDENTFALDSSEKVHFSRPSIDVTFESVAAVYGHKALAVLLSGANADGAAGMKQVKLAGGTAIVQDPQTADVSFMPEQAVKINAYTRIVKTSGIADCILEYLGRM